MNAESDFANTMADAELVAASLRGDRQAFGAIVARYQSLVSAVAYNATGSFSQSEDLAQETFIAAWRELGGLREPSRLRGWLCGIVRNQAGSWVRRNRRQATGVAEPLDDHAVVAAEEPSPGGQVISREEEALLWRTLTGLPELYREPMILFYREGESVARVAMALELSENAVKQRLARGRRMLEERMLAFVEGTLRKSVPGTAFTLGVVAALPALVMSASAATVGATAVKGSVAAKTAAGIGLWGALFGPLLGILGGWLGAKASIENTESPRERRFMVRMSWVAVLGATMFAVALCLLILNVRSLTARHPALFAVGMTALVLVYAGGLTGLIVWSNRRQQRIRQEESARGAAGGPPSPMRPTRQGFEYRSQASLFGWPLIHVKLGGGLGTGRGSARGWIAVGDVAVGVLVAVGGMAAGGIAIGGLSLGVVTLGGLALGGVAAGGWAMGIVALGGGAVAWQFAMGGLAIAREFAVGGLALASHANDEAARTFLRESLMLSGLNGMLRHARWLPLLALLPLVGAMRQLARRKKGRSGGAT